jgi:hypothetical protein
MAATFEAVSCSCNAAILESAFSTGDGLFVTYPVPKAPGFPSWHAAIRRRVAE